MNSLLAQLANQIEYEISSISSEELAWHPDGRWSIAEILEHLSLSYSGTRIVFDRCLQSGKPSARVPTAQDRLRAFLVTSLGYLPSGREAPAGTRPKGKVENIREQISRNLASMDETIGACERHFGAAVKLVDHPILGPFTANQWRKFHCVHGRHHLKQIRNLRQKIGANAGR